MGTSGVLRSPSRQWAQSCEVWADADMSFNPLATMSAIAKQKVSLTLSMFRHSVRSRKVLQTRKKVFKCLLRGTGRSEPFFREKSGSMLSFRYACEQSVEPK